MTATYKVLVDWANDFSFLTGEDRDDDISDDVISVRWRNGFMEPLQDVADEASIEIRVLNTTGKYNPENSSSPLYGYLLPQRRAQIRVEDPAYLLDDDGAYLLDDDGNRLTNNYDDYTYIMATGWIDVIRPSWSPRQRAVNVAPGLGPADIEVTGAKKLLENADVPLTLFVETTADVVINSVLQNIQFPPTHNRLWLLGRSGFSGLGSTTILASGEEYAVLQPGNTIINYYGDTESANAYEIIGDVTAAERGRTYFDDSGRVIFWDRRYLMTRTTVDATVSTITGNYQPTALDYRSGDLLVNSVRVDFEPRLVETTEVLWSLDHDIEVAGNASLQFEITLRRDTGQFVGAEAVSITTLTFSEGTAAVGVLPNGNKATILIANLASVRAIITALIVSGAPVVSQNQAAIIKEDDDTLAVYGRRQMSLNLKGLTSPLDAEDVANFELDRRSTPISRVASLSYVRKRNGVDDLHLNAWTIGTRLRVSVPELSHTNVDYFVIGEEHGMDAVVHEATFYLEPASFHDYWILSVDTLGTGTRLAY